MKSLHQRYFSLVLARAGFQLVAGASVSLKVALLVAVFSLGAPLAKAACVMAGAAVVTVASLIAGGVWVVITAFNKKAAWVAVASMMLAEAIQIVLAASGFLVLMFELQQLEQSQRSNISVNVVNSGLAGLTNGPTYLLLGFIVAVVASVLLFARRQN
jgi:hypothetical protein